MAAESGGFAIPPYQNEVHLSKAAKNRRGGGDASLEAKNQLKEADPLRAALEELHDYFLAGYCYLFGFLDSAEGSDTGAQEFRTTELFHRMFHWNI